MAAVETRLGRIGFAQAGGGEATAIVFLHGVGSDKSVWRSQLEHFGAARRAVAFDYAGYGESGAAGGECTRDDYAAAVFAAMDSLGIGRAHLCGLSLGGVVAIAMHAAAAQRCKSLVLADSFAVHPDGEAICRRGVEASRSIGMAALAAQRAPLLLAPDAPEAVRSAVIETMARIDPNAYRIGARAVWLADQRERAAAIDVPTLVLVGEVDPVTSPALSHELAALIPRARLGTIAGASHIANLDRPDEFNRLVSEFISGIDASAQG